MKTIKRWIKTIRWMWNYRKESGWAERFRKVRQALRWVQNHKDETLCHQTFKRMVKDIEKVSQRDINTHMANRPLLKKIFGRAI